MKSVEVRKGQTPMDIALQEYGHIEGLEYILFDNPNIELTDVSQGDILKIRTDSSKDSNVVGYYKKRNYQPTTE